MKRRKFLQTAAPVAILPSLLGPLSVKALSPESILSHLLLPAGAEDKVLVLIYLNGGNDGLNTVVPLDQLSRLSASRSNILLPEASLLKIVDKQIGLHPALTGFKTLYDENKLQIIQSVGYPVPNFSHFRSTDIWVSASDTDQYLNNGWMGRYLEKIYPGYPLGYPNAAMPDPLALQIGSNMPLLFQGNAAQMAFNVSSPDIFNVNVNQVNDPAPNTPAGSELTYIRTITGQINSYAQKIIAAYIAGANAYGGYPAQGANYLADELKAVARLIKGGLKTRIYLVSLYGFDTHAEQVDANNKTIGNHANLLKLLNDAVFAFQRDLEALGIADRVLGMTFSEFGRRIISNASVGTDHGAAAPLFLFGTQVQPGVLGSNPVIPPVPDDNNNLPMQYDFRSVYASVLSNWFCLDQKNTDDVLLRHFQSLPVVRNQCSTNTFDDINPDSGRLRISLYPNPMTERAVVSMQLPGGKARIELYDPLGRLVYLHALGDVPEGAYRHEIENKSYAPGAYFVRVQCDAYQQTALLQIMR